MGADKAGVNQSKNNLSFMGGSKMSFYIIRDYLNLCGVEKITKTAFENLNAKIAQRELNNHEGKPNDSFPTLKKLNDYISERQFGDLSDFTVFELKEIVTILFSFTPHPEYAEDYRNTIAYVAGTENIFLEYWDISARMIEADNELKEILQLRENVEEYIQRSIKLCADLMYIYPFKEGNEIAVTAFFNLLLKYIKLPPIYIATYETTEYYEALKKAIFQKDISEFEQFFINKIADEISEISNHN
jgi:hypothetical protein